jgi:hypothetical protein
VLSSTYGLYSADSDLSLPLVAPSMTQQTTICCHSITLCNSDALVNGVAEIITTGIELTFGEHSEINLLSYDLLKFILTFLSLRSQKFHNDHSSVFAIRHHWKFVSR